MALYDVQVESILLHPHSELPIVIRSWELGGVRCHIPGHEEIDLLYHLTAQNSPFHKLMRKHPDGRYRMLVRKESMTSHYRRLHGKKRFLDKMPPTFAWVGYSYFMKQLDQIFIENRWFQVGKMNEYNLDVEPRDIQHEMRGKGWNRVPGGGLARPYSRDSDKEDAVSQRIKSHSYKVY